MRPFPKFFFSALLAAFALAAPAAEADETLVAVAANFTAAANEIAAAFEADTGHKAVLSFGSTGKLYTQIAHGAPFQAFLAADRERPEKAEADGLAVPGSRFTYARGKIVLFSADAALVDGAGAILGKPGAFARLAIANPKTAPYGAAAIEAMTRLEMAQGKLVQGDSIAQTHQFVATGNAQLGVIALSQVIAAEGGSRWIVPESLYAPIRQDAVLLKAGADGVAARAFLDYLKGDRARAIVADYGYGIE